MIRYFYSICFLVIGSGLPVLAKSTTLDAPTPSTNSKAGSKGIPTPDPARVAAAAKEQSHKSTEVTLTSDLSRAAAVAIVLSKQDSGTPAKAPEKVKVTEAAKAPVTPKVLESARTAVADWPSRSAAPAPFVIRNSTIITYGSSAPTPLHTASGPVLTSSMSEPDIDSDNTRLARVTAYWASEGDYYTGRGMSATGVHLHDGHCAVDPNIIPYGSVVEIAGIGKFLAVDTGSAVIDRTAAREGGHTYAERHAIVVDLFFEDASEGERFAAGAAKYVAITWYTPTAMDTAAKAARSLFAEENWVKIESKQL